MGFRACMLRCADRSFHVGRTDDLDARRNAHYSGLIRSYASTRLPAKPAWADEFRSGYEAPRAERQIKGWSRAKELAPIRRDGKLIAGLARNSEEKEGASTGAARTDSGSAR